MKLRSFPFGTVVRLEVPAVMTIRALLVDDEAPARSELRYLLAAHPDVQVVGEAASGSEAFELARDLRYDVVFLDVEMPGATGLETAPHVHEQTRSAGGRLRDGARASTPSTHSRSRRSTIC